MFKSIVFACRFFVGCFFILAGIGKLLDVQSFVATLQRFDIAPAALVPVLAVTLPMVETVLGIFLTLGVWTRFASASVSLLVLGFSIVAAINLLRGDFSDCGCFGAFGFDTSGPRTILRNVLFLGASLLVFSSSGSKSPVFDSVLDSAQRGKRAPLVPPGNRSHVTPLRVFVLALFTLNLALAFFLLHRWQARKKARELHSAVATERADWRFPSYGESVPSFAAADVFGTTVSNAELHGSCHVILLWQGNAEGPLAGMLQYCSILKENYRQSGFQVVGIYRGRHADALETVDRLSLNFPVVADSVASISRTLGVTQHGQLCCW